MSRTILLADDSLTIQKVVELTFADTDYHVIAVSNGDELLKRLSDVRPDLIICDVIMPGRDGYDVCQQIKSDPSTLHIPVILLTGTFEPFDKDRAVSAGCSEIVTKPFEARRLVETVEKLAREAELPSEAEVQEERETMWDAAQYEGALRPPAVVQPPVRPIAAPVAPYTPAMPAQPLTDEFATQIAPTAAPEPARRVPFTAPIRVAEVGGFEEVAESPAFEEVGGPADLGPAFEEAPLPSEPAFEEAPVAAEPAFAAAQEMEPAFGEAPSEPVFEESAPPSQPPFEDALEMETAVEEVPAAVEPAIAAPAEPEIGEVSPLDDTLISRRRQQPPVAAPAVEPALPEFPSPVTAPVQPTQEPAPAEVAAAEEPAPVATPSEELAAAPPAITWPAAAPVVAPAVAVAPAEAAPARTTALSDEDVERVARRVLELSRGTLEQIAWEVIPDMAEIVVRERVRQLEAEVESARNDNVQ